MKRYYLLIFLASFPKKKKWLQKLSLYAQKKLSLTAKVWLNIRSSRFKRFNSIEIKDISLSIDTENIFIEIGHLEFSFQLNLFKKQKINYAKLNDIIIKSKPVSVQKNERDFIIHSLTGKQNQIFSLQKKIKKNVTLLPKEIHCNNLSFYSRDDMQFQLNSAIINFRRENNKHDNFQIIINDLTVDSQLIFEQKLEKINFSINLFFSYGDTFFIIDKQSEVKFNQIPFSIYSENDSSNNQIKFAITVEKIHIAEILSSFPNFITKALYSAKSEGTVSFHSLFAFQTDSPLKHFFTASLKKNDFNIQFDESFTLNFLSSPFTHKIYEDNVQIKEKEIDRMNENYCSLNKISKDLIDVIIQTEDPRFFKHKGIDKKLFGYAIATNIAEGKYTRGGSTITMQLVRNLLLTHKKNFYRKLEEIILSWLIEEVFQLSKEHILEIYLNIIQWGPMIYGVKEAANFYFGKSPLELSLTESIVLSYIIPRPKYFCEALELQSLQLKRNLSTHFKKVSSQLLKKQIIAADKIKALDYNITFAGNLGVLNLINID